MRRTNKNRWIPDKESLAKFIELLEKGEKQSRAIKAVGWDESTYYYKKANDDKFTKRINDAIERYELTILAEQTENLLKQIRIGVDITVAISGVGWTTDFYYNRKKKDAAFSRQITAAIAEYQGFVHSQKHSLIRKGSEKVIINELKRLDAINAKSDYRQALNDAMKKAIADLDFEKAESIAKQIEGL